MFRTLKRNIRKSVPNLPVVGPLMLDAYRKAILLRRQGSAKLRSLKADQPPDPETVFWIDPARIVLHTNYEGRGAGLPPKDRVFDPQKDKGAVHGGSWDVSSYRFEELDIFQALQQRIRQETAWADTAFYRRLQAELKAGGKASWGIASQSDLDERCRYLDQLADSIKAHGFKRNHEVSLENERKGVDGHPTFGSEITVNIGRDGAYLFQDGRHRLAIAKILGIRSVPVKVLVRHKEWVEFRQFMRALAQGNSASSESNQLYQNPVHPDLQDIPAAHSCEDRMNVMREATQRGSGNLLDIGANLAFFCHGFEELGYTCFALELLPPCAYAANKIRSAEGRQFTVITGDLFSAAKKEPLAGKHYQIVLALNIFHHFIKQKDIFEDFTQWLKQLNVETMFFEPHCPDEPQMAGSFVNFKEDEFVKFILDNTVLNHSKLLHRCSDGRPVYKLWR